MTSLRELSIAGLYVSRETMAALEQMEKLIRKWTPAVNLVSRASIDDLWSRHIVDSAQLFQFCPPDVRRWLDVGSGGGLPGLVLAILARELRPSLRFVLVESDSRKAAFLSQAAREIGVSVDVHCVRIESLPPATADVLSARAFAPLIELLPVATRHLAADGVAIFPKGARYADEIAQAQKEWAFSADIRPSLTQPDAAILIIRKIQSAKHD
jgi:16S rRNA (guanine527-N7)-methyltransferase